MATSTDAPPGRAGTPGAPGWSGDRLPVAPRRRRPGLAILAVVLILGGALFSSALVLRSGAKQSVILVTRDVPQGQQFSLTDFKQVQVAPGEVQVVGWAHVRELVGKTATADVKSGTLLHLGLVGDDPQPRAGFVIASAALKAGQLPSLKPGEKVRVLWTPHEGLDMRNTPSIPRDGFVVREATVYTVSGLRADGTVLIQLQVPEGRQTDFTRWGYLQSIAVVKLHQAG